MNDALDKLRSEALMACDNGLPEPLVYYLRALEGAYLDMKMNRHKKSLQEITWKHLPQPRADND